MFYSTPGQTNHHLSAAHTPLAPYPQQQQMQIMNNNNTRNNNNNMNGFYTSNSHSQQQQHFPPSVSGTPQGFFGGSNNNHHHNNSSAMMMMSSVSSTPSTNNNNMTQQQNFLLVVNTVDGKKYKLVSKNDIRRLTSAQIKKFIKMSAGIPEEVQALRFRGKILADSDYSCVGDVGVGNGDVISLDDLRMYANNDQVRNLQEHNRSNLQHQLQPPQFYHSGNPAYINGPPETLQDLARGAGGLPSSSSSNFSGLMMMNPQQRQDEIFHSNQEQVIMQQQQQQNRNSSNSISPNRVSQQQQQPSPNLQAATSIIEMQKRLLQREIELTQQQEALQKMIQQHHEDRAIETRKLLDDSINASQQTTRSEMSQIREEIKRLENLQQQQQQQQQLNNNNNKNKTDEQQQQQQELSPRGSALASQPSFSNLAKRPPAPPSVKQQPTSNPNSSGVFITPRNNNNNEQAAAVSPNSALIQDAMRIANNNNNSNSNNNLVSSSSFSGGGVAPPPSPPKRVPMAFKNLPLRDKAFNLVVFAVKKLILLSYISPQSLNDDSFPKDADTWTVDLINQSKLAQQQLFLQQHQQQIINPAEEESGAVNSVLFSYDEESSRIYLYTTLLHFIPQHDPLLKLALYEMLLEGALMGREMVGGGVGVSAKSNLVLMATSIDVRHCGDEEALADVVGEFVDSAQSWSRACMQVLQQQGTSGGRRSAAF